MGCPGGPRLQFGVGLLRWYNSNTSRGGVGSHFLGLIDALAAWFQRLPQETLGGEASRFQEATFSEIHS